MAITKSTFTTIQQLADWLSANAVPEYCASVYLDTTDTGTFGIYLRDENDDNLFRIGWNTNGNGFGGFTLYKTAGGSSVGNFPSSVYAITPNGIAAKCGGGILIQITSTIQCIITKTNNNKFAAITSACNPASITTLFSVALGDASDDNKTIQFHTSPQNQTQLISFTTYAQAETVSYTPNAFYMPVGEYYNLDYGKFEAGGSTYITNGFWAIKDA